MQTYLQISNVTFLSSLSWFSSEAWVGRASATGLQVFAEWLYLIIFRNTDLFCLPVARSVYLFTITCIYGFVSVSVCVCTGGTRVEVRGQLVGVRSLFPSSEGLMSGPPPLPTVSLSSPPPYILSYFWWPWMWEVFDRIVNVLVPVIPGGLRKGGTPTCDCLHRNKEKPVEHRIL